MNAWATIFGGILFIGGIAILEVDILIAAVAILAGLGILALAAK